MPLSEGLLREFDQEIANTRKTLERVPETKLGWKPHDKSGTMAWLASHVATIPSWGEMVLREQQFDVGAPGQRERFTQVPGSVKEILAMFDRHAASARATIAGTPDPEWLQPWSLLVGGKPLFTFPRIAVFRGMVMNHLIHHRGQLTVYLRLNDVPVPALYGPSADESPM